MERLSKSECEIYMIILKNNGITLTELLDKFSKQRRMDYARTTLATFIKRLEEKDMLQGYEREETAVFIITWNLWTS